MKKIKLLFCFSLLTFHFSLTYGQQWLWGRDGDSALKNNDAGAGVACDKAGNAYITGYYAPQISFGSHLLDDSGSIYLVKYDKNGNVVWARRPIGHGYGSFDATDNFGNVFFAGSLSGSLAFSSSVKFNGGADMYIVKYDLNGNPKWVTGSSGGDECYSTGVAPDNNGNAFVTGYFAGSVTFGLNTFNTYSNNNLLYNSYISKFDSNGNLLWAKQVIGTLPDSNHFNNDSHSVATDDSGNVFIAGGFSDTAVFGSLNLYSPGTTNVFLAKYNSSGTLLWAKQSVAPLNTSNGTANSVTVDPEGNPYITGHYSGSIKFGPLFCFGKQPFLGKIRGKRKCYLGKTGFGFLLDRIFLFADKNNHLLFGGEGGSRNFTFGNLHLTSPLVRATVPVIEFDSSGTPLCGELLRDGGDFQIVVTSDQTGNYSYVTGSFHDNYYDDSIFCGSDTLICYNGGKFPYLVRWLACGQNFDGISEPRTKNDEILVFPNPFTSSTTILVESGKYKVESYLELYDVTGQKLKSVEFTGNTYTLSAEGLAKGMYFIRVSDKDNNVIGTSKIVVQ